MKRFAIFLLTMLIPFTSFATDSRSNKDIPETKIIDTEPEDENEEVVPPEVDIVPDTPETEELKEELRTIFRLIINYVYSDGNIAATPYDATLQDGTAYSVVSPSINGYSTVTPLVDGVMPKRDVVIIVIYFSETEENTAFNYSNMISFMNIGDYETPLGLGFNMPNLGFTFE